MLKGFGTLMAQKTGRLGLKMKQYSPEILMVVGTGCVIGGTVMACRATLKVDEIIKEKDKNIDKIKYAKENVSEEKYSKEDYAKDLTITYVQTAVKMAKIYAPAVTMTAVGIGCFCGAYGIMKKRNVALMAAYKIVEKGFSEYRKRVIEDVGVEKDKEYRYGVKTTVVEKEVTDAKGKTKTVKETINVLDGISEYAKYFDESSTQFMKSPDHNLSFLRGQQNYANEMLKTKGHVFLNEVYDMLGLPRTSAGSIVGWVYGNGDSYIDFGIYSTNISAYSGLHNCDTVGEERRDFVNGYKSTILLDFNVDGVIYDLI